MQIHQVLPAIIPGDAIGNEAILIQKILRNWGYNSEIYAEHIHPQINAHSYKHHKKKSSKENILIYHYGIGSDITDYVMKIADKKILLYHNITPYQFYSNINDNLALLLSKGREDLKKLVNYVDIAVGDSEYNCLELREFGYKNSEVLPLILDFSDFNNFDQKIIDDYKDDYKNILFVGRIAPNKKQEDIIKCFYYYKNINPKSRLILIGSYSGAEKYLRQLQQLIVHLSLKDVHIIGSTEFTKLMAYYRIADLFLCMSEHEGFSAPLVESMYFGIPIIAYNSTAIPYTLGGAGILVNKKIYPEIAEMMNLIFTDQELRDKIIKKQNIRLKYFDYEKQLEIFKNRLDKVIKK